MIIPISIAFYEEQLYEYMIANSQLEELNYVESKFMNLSYSSSFYSIFDYFRKK